MASTNHGVVLAEAVELRRRRLELTALRRLVEDPDSTEQNIHARLKGQTWIFGGRYIGQHTSQRLTTEDIVDIPLIRGDGSLHVVELKKAAISRLAYRHRNHVIVGADVHEAMSQAANYLRSLDEERYALFGKHRVDCSRASATVLIGHPKVVGNGITRAELGQAFRTYNSHLSRVEVLTYGDLLDNAEQSLSLLEALEQESGDVDS